MYIVIPSFKNPPKLIANIKPLSLIQSLRRSSAGDLSQSQQYLASIKEFNESLVKVRYNLRHDVRNLDESLSRNDRKVQTEAISYR